MYVMYVCIINLCIINVCIKSNVNIECLQKLVKQITKFNWHDASQS